MTKQLVEFQLDDGTPIVFETSEDIPSGGTERVSRGSSTDGAVATVEPSYYGIRTPLKSCGFIRGIPKVYLVQNLITRVTFY